MARHWLRSPTIRHFIQNIGDGTFHHSGSLAIRAAVAAGIKITFRLLYNDAVAMTGGQAPPGRMARALSCPRARARGRQAGDRHDPRARALPGRRARSRRQRPRTATSSPHAQRELAARRRGHRPDPRRPLRGREAAAAQARQAATRRHSASGSTSGCARAAATAARSRAACRSSRSQTEFGRKTQIHQSSCNQDFACLKGDCPSFVVVTPKARGRERDGDPAPADPPAALPAHAAVPVRRRARATVLVRMPGVGGTGVVTVSQILQMAAPHRRACRRPGSSRPAWRRRAAR